MSSLEHANPEMPREEKLATALKLCASFARNLAYYRVGWWKEHLHLLDPAKRDNTFWLLANGTCLDMCVLEWCKLFEKGEKHYWGKIVTDAAGFKEGLLRHLGLDEETFQKEIDVMGEYRDKWVAHQDLNRSGFRPKLDVPKKAVWFYYAYIVEQGVKPAAHKLPDDIDAGYKQEEDMAKAIYQRQT
ncbi:MAG: hypothetical protein WA005_16945 [Candidatus Binataceae bacterium]